MHQTGFRPGPSDRASACGISTAVTRTHAARICPNGAPISLNSAAGCAVKFPSLLGACGLKEMALQVIYLTLLWLLNPLHLNQLGSKEIFKVVVYDETLIRISAYLHFSMDFSVLFVFLFSVFSWSPVQVSITE